jgi:hypothetical protein
MSNLQIYINNLMTDVMREMEQTNNTMKWLTSIIDLDKLSNIFCIKQNGDYNCSMCTKQCKNEYYKFHHEAITCKKCIIIYFFICLQKSEKDAKENIYIEMMPYITDRHGIPIYILPDSVFNLSINN